MYKNLISDYKKSLKVLSESEKDDEGIIFKKWNKWSEFGMYMDPQEKIKESVENLCEKHSMQKETLDEIKNAFKISVSHFLNEYGVDYSHEWLTMGPSFCKYFSNLEPKKTIEVEKELAMMPHTDYQWYEFDSDTNKYAVTCTIYLNDDYSGGELIFTTSKNGEPISYKPKAGDVVVFPSGNPDLFSENGLYYHAVGKINDNEKYFIRYFYLLPGKPSEDYIKYKNIYGEDLWNAE